MGRPSPSDDDVGGGRSRGTVLRHVTSETGRAQSVEELDPALAAASKGRMAALLGVVSVAYVLSFVVELVMRWGPGLPVFTDVKLAQNLGGAVATGTVFWWLRSSRCSFRAASYSSYAVFILVGLNETLQSMRIVEWPRLWPAVQDVPGFIGPSLVGGLPWTWLLLVLFPPFLPGTPKKHFLVAVSIAAPMLAIAGAWAWFGDVRFWTILSPVAASNLPVCLGLSVAMSVSIHRINRALQVERRRSRELGSYELVRELGRGGMGVVWLARHKMLARPAALKLIKFDRVHGSQARASQVLRRFEREAQATAQLSSVHTVTLYDFGRTDNGDFYYVMEMLDGLDLDALVDRYGPQPAARVIDILRQACLSLAEAHESGLVHRDVKPANIFLCRQGRELDVVKVLDFGLVTRRSAGSDGGSASVTKGEDLLGTPAFMAPEMVTGRKSADHRADLYALGCVGYWLLTGRFVFDHDTPMEMAVAHVHSPLPTPLFGSGDESVPDALERLIAETLAKDPGERPQSAAELMARLDEIEVPDAWTEADRRSWWSDVPRVDGGADAR